MKSEKLDRRITIQRKTEIVTDGGGVEESWSNLALRRPASMRPIRGDETFAAPEFQAQQQVEFRIRYSSEVSDLTPLDRIIYPALHADSPEEEPDGRGIFDITAVHEIGRREGLQILAFRRPDVTE